MVNNSSIKAFCQEYSQTVEQLPGVTWVEFIGSAANGKFVPGKSDLDVFVHGNNIPAESKRRAKALIRQLNDKYKLGLETAPCPHPTPFFIDGNIKRKLYHLLKGRWELSWLRGKGKKIAPRYGLVWRLRGNDKRN